MSDQLNVFDAMLDTDVDNIEDLPEFETFAPGAYMLQAGKVKLVPADPSKEKDGGVMLMFSNAGVMELADPEGTEAAKEGALISASFYGEFGIKRLKAVFGDAMASVGANTLREFLDQFEGLTFAAAVQNRKDKNDPTKVYNDIKSVVIPG